MATKRWNSKTSFNTCCGSTESFSGFNDCSILAGNYHGNYEEPIFTNDVLAQEEIIPLTCANESRTSIKSECALIVPRTSFEFNQANVHADRNVSICSFKECCHPEDCTHIQPQNVKNTASYFPSEVKDENTPSYFPSEVKDENTPSYFPSEVKDDRDDIFNPTAKTVFSSETLRTEAPQAETRANDETCISTSSANPSDNGFLARFLVNKFGISKAKQREEEMGSQNTIILRKYTEAPSKDASAEGVLSKKEMKKAEKERLKQEQKQKGRKWPKWVKIG